MLPTGARRWQVTASDWWPRVLDPGGSKSGWSLMLHLGSLPSFLTNSKTQWLRVDFFVAGSNKMHTHQNSNPTSLRVFSRFAAKGLEFFFLHLKGPNPWNFAILKILEKDISTSIVPICAWSIRRLLWVDLAAITLSRVGWRHCYTMLLFNKWPQSI